MNANTWQSQPERGSAFWIGVLVRVARLLGRSATCSLLWPIALYFVGTGSAARRAAHDYLRRVLGRKPNLWDVARMFHTFAVCTLDRFLVLSGNAKSLHTRPHWIPAVEAITRSGNGCLLLVSHLGSFEVLSHLSSSTKHVPLRVLLDRAQGRMLTNLFEHLNPDFAASIIDAGLPGPQLVLAMREALDSGCNIGIMADRVRGSETSVDVQFLGGTARLPAAPWNLAIVLKVPVVLAFAIYRGGRTYDIYFEMLSERIESRRDERAAVSRRWAQRYANALELRVRDAPYNWFNFFPFWTDEAADD